MRAIEPTCHAGQATRPGQRPPARSLWTCRPWTFWRQRCHAHAAAAVGRGTTSYVPTQLPLRCARLGRDRPRHRWHSARLGAGLPQDGPSAALKGRILSLKTLPQRQPPPRPTTPWANGAPNPRQPSRSTKLGSADSISPIPAAWIWQALHRCRHPLPTPWTR